VPAFFFSSSRVLASIPIQPSNLRFFWSADFFCPPFPLNCVPCSPMVFSRQFSSVPIFLCTVCHVLSVTYRSQLLLPISIRSSSCFISGLCICICFADKQVSGVLFPAYTREHMFVSPPLSPSELRNFFHAYDLECGSNRVFLCPTGSWFFFSARQTSFFLRLIQPSPSNAGPESNRRAPVHRSPLFQSLYRPSRSSSAAPLFVSLVCSPLTPHPPNWDAWLSFVVHLS